MHVARLDVPWYRSPFLRHSFLVKTDKQIEKLRRAGVQALEIDPSRGLDCVEPAEVGEDPLIAASPTRRIQKTDQPQVRSLATLTAELQTARTARAQLERSVQATFSRIAETGVVDPAEVKRATLEISAVAQTLGTHALFMAFSQGRNADPSFSQHALATCSFSLILGHAAELDLMAMQDLATGALLHDIGGLAVAGRAPELRLLVLDNAGGGILHFLPQAAQLDASEFEALLGTPSELRPASALRTFGFEVAEPATPSELDDALASDARAVVVDVDRGRNRELHRELADAAAAVLA